MAVNKFNFLLIPIFTCVIMHLVYLPPPPPTNFAKPFCSISLGTTVIEDIGNNGYGKIGGERLGGGGGRSGGQQDALWSM